MRRQSRGSGALLTAVATIAVFSLFGFVIWNNGQQKADLRVLVPTVPAPTDVASSWQDVLRAGFNAEGSPIPTISLPDPNRTFVAPTLAPETNGSATPFSPIDGNAGSSVVFIQGATPTLPPPTPTIPSVGTEINVIQVPTSIVRATGLPSLNVPISRDPLGWDHYWFRRPLSADLANSAIPYYAYGTDGSRGAPLLIHTGIDLPNPEGSTVRAAGAGTVIFSTDPTDPTQTVFDNSAAYGIAVVIEHDFGFQGEPVYTVYAHLLSTLVKQGDTVNAGDPIALMGSTGHSSGPHVHFEVRLTENRFGSTYNPALWIAPYVGHGTIAGKVIGARGEYLDDVDVQLVRAGIVQKTTTSYVFKGTGSEVNPDPNWEENFVFFDVPAGNYSVESLVNGTKVTQRIQVFEGMTTGVELRPPENLPLTAPTATP
jgi:hypothetical protein